MGNSSNLDLTEAGNSDQACNQVTGTIKIGTEDRSRIAASVHPLSTSIL